MALFKILKGQASNLGKESIRNGYCYVTLDNHKMYIDHVDTDNNGKEISNSGTRFCLNAEAADKLSTARTITLSGDASGSVSFDGSKNVTLTVDIEELDNIKEAIDTKQATITGAATTITSSNLTANRALISNSSGKVAISAVTSTELGYLDGVTSNIQTQLNNHTHNYAGSSSAGGAATSANKLNTDAGSATQPVYFSNGIPVKTTYTLGASVPSNAKFTDTVYTLPAAGPSLGGVKSGGDVTISNGVITVKDDSHNHTIANIDNLQTTLDTKAAKNTGIFYIEGTGDTAGTWLGSHSDITEYYAGLILAYKIGVAGLSSGTTLNINNLGAVTVVKNATSAISTNFAVNSVIFLVYTIDSSGAAYWKAHDYDSNTKTTTGTSNKASTKLFLTGATSQTSSGTTTYSNSKVYIGTDNCLYSNGKKVSTTDTNTTYTFATGSSNGTISVTPSGGTATNVAVKGLGSAAYTASTAYDAAGTAQTKADAALASAKTYADGIKNDLLNGAGAAYDTLKELGDLIDDNTDAIDALEIVATNKANKSHTHAASDITSGTLASARIPAATTSAIGGVKIGSNIKVSSGTISVPSADGSTAGVTIVYPAASCTTFSSDSGTVTPLAVQKGAKMFAITRPTSSTNKAITRYSNTTGDVQDSKIIIEDVTNTRDSSKKAQVIAIPAEDGKKMVYGYCTDQVDGTSFIGGIFDADATEYPYNQGLAIGGTSGNLLWKGVKVATTSDIPAVGNGTVTIKQNGTNKGSFTLNQSGNATIELTDTDTNTTYSAATTSTAGLMSATDKKKLDGIATGANNYTYTLPSATSSVLGGVKVGSNITVSSGTISLTKNNVTSALGYTPPTTNTTYGSMSINEGTTGTATTSRVLTAANLKGIINAHAPTKTGGGASGTWGISISGKAATATKLATARTIQTNLASTAAASFDGSTDVTPGVTGVLPIAHGGTGASDALSGYYNLAWRGTPTSLNDASSIGFYKINPDVTNTPYASMWGACMLLTDDAKTTGNTSGSVWQMAFTTASTDLHLRCRTNGTDWQGWHKLLTSNNYSDYCAPREHTHSYLPLTGGTLSGPIYVHNSNMTISAGKIEQYGGAPYGGLFSNGVAFTNPTTQNDAAWLRVTGTSENDTVFEIAVGDDGNNSSATVEEIVVRQYGTDSSVHRQITLLDKSGNSHFRAAYGAVWNDYAEFRNQKEEIKPGYCVASADNGQVYKTTEKFQACDGIVSDTFGFIIGETDECKTPLAVAGRVLAYCEGDRYSYHSGDTVCAGPNGRVVKMTREEIREWPDRIVGIVSEIPEYKTWGTANVEVDGRIWIKVV